MPIANLRDVALHYVLDGVSESRGAISPHRDAMGTAAASCDTVLVLSHGLGLDLGMWEGQAEAFKARGPVLRYDARGHGASSDVERDASIEDLARDLVELLDHLRIARIHICGLSLGGMTGMWLAANAPDRVASLVLANTAPRVGTRAMWDARIATVAADGMAAIADAALARWFTPAFIARQSDAAARVRNVFERTSGPSYARCCAANRDADLCETVARVRVPTLVIAGTHDVATPPEDGRWLARTIPAARYVELDAAHLSNLESADAFNTAVIDHLSRVDATVREAA